MNTEKKQVPREFQNQDSKIRLRIALWIIVICTIQFLTINTILLFFSGSFSNSSVELKILVGANSALLSTVLFTVIRYYFPRNNRSELK